MTWVDDMRARCRENAVAAETMQFGLDSVEMIERQRQDKKLNEIRRLRDAMGERFQDRRFENFEPRPGSERGRAAAVAVADAQYCRGLGLYGTTPGVGKSHLLAAVVNRAIDDGVAAIFTTSADLLAKIRATYDGGDGSEYELLARYADADVLALDDLGKEPSTEWALSMLWAIINRRYERQLPLLVSANLSFEKLVATRYARVIPGADPHVGVTMMDRILEMTGPWIEVTGRSLRAVH